MEAAIIYPQDEISKAELHCFIKEGLQDVSQNRLLDFDTVFDELEVRYHADE